MKHAMRIVVLFATMATMTASPAKAQVGYSAWFNNFNVWNYSGQTANDFELYLGGVSSNQIKTYYTGSYPDYAVTNVADGVIVEWTGSTTANGAYAHFGVHLNPFVNPSAFNLTWTSNGTNIESVQTVQSHWGTTNIAPVNIITNPRTRPGVDRCGGRRRDECGPIERSGGWGHGVVKCNYLDDKLSCCRRHFY